MVCIASKNFNTIGIGSLISGGADSGGGGGGGGTYWLDKLTGGAGFAQNAGTAGVDGSGNIYVFNSPSSVTEILKINSSGALQWQKEYQGPLSGTSYILRSAITTAGDIYCISSQPSSGINPTLIKINTSGTLQWQKQHSLGSNDGVSLGGVCVDSTGAPYFLMSGGSTGVPAILAKLTSAGALTWQRSILTDPNSTGTAVCLTVDGADNTYSIVVDLNLSTTSIIKYNSAGTLQWQKTLPVGEYLYCNATCDTSNNLYIATAGTILKLNSSGVLQWQRNITGAPINFSSLCVDNTSGDVYAAGNITVINANRCYIIKLNSAGNITWQRGVTPTAGTPYSLTSDAIRLTPSGSLAYCMYYQHPTSVVGEALWQIPADGTKTGVYSGLTYGTESLTSTTTPYTVSVGTGTLATPAGTLSNDTGILANGSSSVAFTTIP